MRRLRTRDWIFLALILAVAVACIRLGVWQLDRRADRREANANLAARLDAPPRTITAAEPGMIDLEFRRVQAEGEWDPVHAILLKNRSFEGQPGFHLVTPLIVKNTRMGILVERGWVSVEEGSVTGLPHYGPEGMVLVSGIARLSQPEPGWSFLADAVPQAGDPPLLQWRLVNIEGIQRQIPYPLLPIYIIQTDPSELDGHQPRPNFEIDLTEGPHLGYAIQWFAFTAIALVGGGVWFRRLMRSA